MSQPTSDYDRQLHARDQFMREQLKLPHPGVSVRENGVDVVLSWDEYCRKYGRPEAARQHRKEGSK